jgi:hypothetical protein
VPSQWEVRAFGQWEIARGPYARFDTVDARENGMINAQGWGEQQGQQLITDKEQEAHLPMAGDSNFQPHHLPGTEFFAGCGKNQVWLSPSGVHSVAPVKLQKPFSQISTLLSTANCVHGRKRCDEKIEMILTLPHDHMETVSPMNDCRTQGQGCPEHHSHPYLMFGSKACPSPQDDMMAVHSLGTLTWLVHT